MTGPYAVTVLTPVLPGHEDALRTDLARLLDAGGRSPLGRVPGTHFARWVVVPETIGSRVHRPADRTGPGLGSPYLLFTSTSDDPEADHLRTLCEEVAREAALVWRHCTGCPAPAEGAALLAYLLHNRLPTGLLHTAYDATVPQVLHSLDVRDRLLRVLAATQGVPAAARSAFVEEFCR